MITYKQAKILVVGLVVLLIVCIVHEVKATDTQAEILPSKSKAEELVPVKESSKNSIKQEILIEEKASNVLTGYTVDQEQTQVLLETGEGFYADYLDVTYFEGGYSNVCEDVRAYEKFVAKQLSKHGLKSHTEFFLALLQKESGCLPDVVNADIAQSSESLDLPPNTITDPFESIVAGVNLYTSLINEYEGKVDARFILQSYNYGPELVKEAIQDNAEFTIVYLIEKSKEYKIKYLPEQKRKKDEWRPVDGEYGDFRYVANLFSIYTK